MSNTSVEESQKMNADMKSDIMDLVMSILTDSKIHSKMVMEVPVQADSKNSTTDEVLKLKNIKKDGYTRFQHQEQHEHVGPEVTISQDDEKRLCLVDDLKEVQVHIQVKTIRTSSSLKS
ncbi:hypothetical protein Tco_0858133 [Tanacetum coccineum]|uniref:Ty3-gypsy retrotransposon protein n=1 Tax=Tanacetum coccineum TaxID=301880 RepID=A0ABQ5B890_9ASTR